MDEIALREQEESLRNQVAQLSPEARKQYYQLEEQLVKDPDTYAVLNYFFAAGLHHFYLGKTARGVINLTLMLLGLVFILFYGWVLLILVCLIELPQLFNSQKIVRKYNIDVMREVLDELKDTQQSQTI
ncbi:MULTISPECIES: TM2 domain-containing protein [Pseudoalteromonas]|uniref:TM2 domain-containing protein n=1 Tax=Pseudoalteromonas TaxID=53246 RepID=UPI001573AE2A|nr:MULTISPECIES: TM2 domain-containing protein [Pseudoalteromonas]MBR8845067.1 TM2 domain-containing protein [Pseudoalteromonas sp. JC3]MCF2828021.1 TM2 domain-containing protein [Pseudoalteromonas sp. OF5H-5]MCF2830349.1 TM2 domain-containing protein [Pseudoalteromonas sp. DL2-H6]MCF2924196.1 TM2 domain-containing protein [Pseudoalteromonas sp. DL2-H1]NSY33609.1 TM2 domain-containing protein [Pseudoalteromonas sp. JC28]